MYLKIHNTVDVQHFTDFLEIEIKELNDFCEKYKLRFYLLRMSMTFNIQTQRYSAANIGLVKNGVRYFPKGNFPKVRLGPLRRHRLQCWPSASARICQGPSAAGQTCEVASREISHLGTCLLGKQQCSMNYEGPQILVDLTTNILPRLDERS